MSDVTPNKNVAGCYTKSHNVDVSIHLYGLRMFKMDGNLKAKGFFFGYLLPFYFTLVAHTCGI